MVRISSRASRRKTNLLGSRKNRNGRHFFHLFLLCIITLCGSLYFFLLRRDVKAATTHHGPHSLLQHGVKKHQQQQRMEYEKTDEEEGEEEGYEEEEGQEVNAGEGGYSAEEEEQENGEGGGGDDGEAEEEEPVDTSEILSASKVLELGVPFLMYGTAWKKDQTSRLVEEAIQAGFRFIDTACQPKHYNEAQVGEGWVQASQDLGLQREDIFLQTKFSSASAQDPKDTPYDPSLPLTDQVWRSLEVSLENLQTDYLDSWVMHGPETTMEKTMEVYRVMEQAVDESKVKRLGISNCYNIDTFKQIYDMARIKPEVLQNRFYGESKWDQELRAFCQEHDIWYQSFWTLTANRDAIQSPEALEWAESKGLPSGEHLLYAYLMSLGYGTPLDGTSSYEHMEQDIVVMQRVQREFLNQNEEEKIFESDEDMRSFERLLGF